MTKHLPVPTNYSDPPAIKHQVPEIIAQAGGNAQFAWDEFFQAKIRNEHTRRAYRRSVLKLLRYCELQDVELRRISPAHVGTFLDSMNLAVTSKKQVLAGIRHFFDCMVTRHAIALNPALSVRGERYSVIEGKTPEISVKQARKLLQSINTTDVVGQLAGFVVKVLLRDQCAGPSTE